jgi:CheY-like chemotaxis protein
VVDTVADGAEAISYLEANSKPDFILMDIRMPRMNGTEAIEKIRTNTEFDDVKIFAVSGTPAEQSGLDTQAKSVAKWFHKPLQPAKLVRTIDSIFSNALAK